MIPFSYSFHYCLNPDLPQRFFENFYNKFTSSWFINDYYDLSASGHTYSAKFSFSYSLSEKPITLFSLPVATSVINLVDNPISPKVILNIAFYKWFLFFPLFLVFAYFFWTFHSTDTSIALGMCCGSFFFFTAIIQGVHIVMTTDHVKKHIRACCTNLPLDKRQD